MVFPSKFFLFFCLIGCTMLLLIFVYGDGFYSFGRRLLDMGPAHILSTSYSYAHNGKFSFQVNTPGCQIPAFDPFDTSIRSLYSSVGKLICSGPPPLVIRNRTHLTVDHIVWKKHYSSHKTFRCYYRRITRNGDGLTDDRISIEKMGHEIKDIMVVEDEFLYIECVCKGRRIYTAYEPFIQMKKDVEERCSKRFKNWEQKTNNTIQERLSVAFVGIDSVSRLNFLRHFPKTYAYLSTEMNALDLHGFNKVADNTFLNVMPMLSGKYVEECWNETLKKVPLDYLPLIWKDFSEKGYRTLFSEDAPYIATFNYLKAGFYEQPTDYYYRPFTLATEKSTMRRHSRQNCFNTRPEPSMNLQWLAHFLETFHDEPLFAYLFNSRLTHDILNNAGYADDPYYRFLQQVHSEGFLNRTVLFFFSDHGIRFGKIRDTYIGKLEERLPFFFIAFPLWFSSKYPQLWKILEANQRRLTTPFDIYETLQDLLHFTGKIFSANISSRGISLFKEIPVERTCEDAAILSHWCTCHVREPVELTDSRVIKAAQILVSHMNFLLKDHLTNCLELHLYKIEDARMSRINEQILRFKASNKDVIGRKVSYGHRVAGITDFLLTVMVTPSEGVFEGTVRNFEENNKYVVVGDISRINVYGNESACIDDPSVRKFCYCSSS